jgi:hypothetical protein
MLLGLVGREACMADQYVYTTQCKNCRAVNYGHNICGLCWRTVDRSLAETPEPWEFCGREYSTPLQTLDLLDIMIQTIKDNVIAP